MVHDGYGDSVMSWFFHSTAITAGIFFGFLFLHLANVM